VAHSAAIKQDAAPTPSIVRDWVLVSLITVAGAVMRLSTMLIRGLWLDEAISVYQANRPVL